MPGYKKYFKLKYFKEPWRIIAIIKWQGMKLFGNTSYHYAEQVIWRMSVCPDCVAKNSCDYCPCSVSGMMISPSGRCSDQKWGKMMNEKDWNKYKDENNVRILCVDPKILRDNGRDIDEANDKYEELKDELDLLNAVKRDYDNYTRKIRKLKEKRWQLEERKEDLIEEYEAELSLTPQSVGDAVVSIEDVNKDFQNINEDDMEKYIDKIKIENKNVPSEIDLGVVPRNVVKTYEFKYNGKLEIKSISTSCECMDEKIKGNVITGRVEISNKPGEYKKSIFLDLKPDKQYYGLSGRGKLVQDNRDIKIKVILRYKVL